MRCPQCLMENPPEGVKCKNCRAELRSAAAVAPGAAPPLGGPLEDRGQFDWSGGGVVPEGGSAPGESLFNAIPAGNAASGRPGWDAPSASPGPPKEAYARFNEEYFVETLQHLPDPRSLAGTRKPAPAASPSTSGAPRAPRPAAKKQPPT